jgi:sugar phosphate isomerase/epimerase
MKMRWVWFVPQTLLIASSIVYAQLDTKALLERSKVKWKDVPKKVLAFYYGWYHAKSWRDVDEAKKYIANVTHYPLLGPYSSQDPKVLEQHCRWAKEAQIDGFIVSWWRPNDYNDKTLSMLLEVAEDFNLQVTAYFETVPDNKRETALKDVLYLLERYGKHKAWLKVNGKPVLFVYGRAVGQIGVAGWLWVINEVNRQYEGGAVFIGDQISKPAARVFDGIHTYNPTGQTAGKSVDEIRLWARETFQRWVEIAGGDRIACVTIIPGYDDSKLDRPKPRPITERHNGMTYRVMWEEAIKANPDWVIITSWNEWFEGSEIEPSVENGERELKTTAEYAPKFKALPPRKPKEAKTAIGEHERQTLLKALHNRKISLLPDASSEAVWVMVNWGIEVTPISWEQVVDESVFNPNSFAIAVYAGGEVYRPTVHHQNDVLKALRRYVEAGGTLLVLPAAPMPFHYDEARLKEQDRGTVYHSPALGLPLTIAWESPPKELKLNFVVLEENLLKHLPKQFPFPQSGDLRWRPLLPEKAEPNAKVKTLIELRDEGGKSHGAGSAIVSIGKGRIVYVWFRLLNMDIGEPLLFDILSAL